VADVEWGRASAQVISTDLGAYAAWRRRVEPFGHFWRARRELVDAFIRESADFQAAREAGLEEPQALASLRGDAAFMQKLRAEKTRLQAGFVAIDPRNGHVKAWVGSRDFALDPFDHVQQARRQPGSTFKPFVYGAAFEQGLRPHDTRIDAAVAFRLPDGDVWRPSDARRASGEPMSLRDALVFSRNTITAQVMLEVGPVRAAEVAHAMGVRESRLDAVPSLALGTSPVTLKEMAAGYATIANDGQYVEPLLVTRVEDRHGRVLARFAAPPEPAVSRETAHALVDAMRGVVDRGTGTAIRERFGIQADVAGKTGTTQNNTDAWFILMHPQLVAGAWIGFNDNRVTMRSDHWGQGGHSALHVVGEFFQQALDTRAIDPRAAFAAPREPHEPPGLEPLLRDVGTWLEGLLRGIGGRGNKAAGAP
jgi:penicillin-binding protein 1A